jgi:iron complex transport system ATP-binding protein
MITAENISLSIGSKSILEPMRFHIPPGRLTVLLGPNGAGKTSLLRILSGELKPGGGDVFFNGVPLKELSIESLAKKRAMLMQHYSVPLPFTCEEIVMMGRYPHYKTSTALRNAGVVDRCMKEMDVARFADRLFHTLSGGEQQRVQLARVLAQLEDIENPADRILLLDEPTASMDWLNQQMILSRLRGLSAEGYTVVVVLHDLNLAAQYAEHILLLKSGRLESQGSVGEVLNARLISSVYGIPVEVVRLEDYPFPLLVPASGKITIHHIHKNQKNGKYTNGQFIKE